MPEQSGITPEDIKDWETLEVTRLFFSYVNVHLEDADRLVHTCLGQNQKDEAALHNAGMVQIQEIIAIPESMKEDLEEE